MIIPEGNLGKPDDTRSCPFCAPSEREWVHTRVFYDKYPVAPGHMLVVPKRHVPSLLDATEEEYAEMMKVVREIATTSREHPDGWNIGVNIGTAAGQTVMHAHIHVIPRTHGDVADPRGGVRWVNPEKAVYWE